MKRRAKTNVKHIEQARAEITFNGKKAVMTLDWEKPSRFYIHVRGMGGLNKVIADEHDPRAILLEWTRAMKKHAGELVARTPKQRDLQQKQRQLAAGFRRTRSMFFAPEFLRELRKAELREIRYGKNSSAYKAYFDRKLKEWGIKSPAELDDAKKRKFFEEVDKGWKSDEEKKGTAKRDYAKEYRDYHGKPEQKKNRAKRNSARRELGLEKGDSREVDHKTPLSKGGGNGKANLRAVSRKTNRQKGDKAASTRQGRGRRAGDKDAYKAYFDKKLKEWGIKSPADLDEAKKRKFFEEVDKGWKSDEEGGSSERSANGREEEWAKVHLPFAKEMGSQIKAIKPGSPTGDYWQSGHLLNIGPLVGERYIGIPLSIGTQFNPRDKYQFHATVQTSMSGPKDKAKWEPYYQAIALMLPKALKSALARYGKVQVLKPGGQGWPGVWVNIPEDKIDEAMKGIPKLARPLGAAIDKAIKSVKPPAKSASTRQARKDPQIAKTILKQLGGSGRLKAMLGAKNFIDHGNGLSFKFPNPKRNKGNYFKVTLDEGSDTYNLEIGKVAGYNYKKLKEWQGVYADQMKRIFEGFTGLRMSL